MVRIVRFGKSVAMRYERRLRRAFVVDLACVQLGLRIK